VAGLIDSSETYAKISQTNPCRRRFWSFVGPQSVFNCSTQAGVFFGLVWGGFGCLTYNELQFLGTKGRIEDLKIRLMHRTIGLRGIVMMRKPNVPRFWRGN